MRALLLMPFIVLGVIANQIAQGFVAGWTISKHFSRDGSQLRIRGGYQPTGKSGSVKPPPRHP
jgi:hypothetical protein